MCPHVCTQGHKVKMHLLCVAVTGFRELSEISWPVRQDNYLVVISSLVICWIDLFFFSVQLPVDTL